MKPPCISLEAFFMAFRPKTYSDEELLTGLNSGTLPPLDFTHRAHVRLVWIISNQRKQSEVFDEVSKTIRRYANAIDEGQIYHETLTYASVMIITGAMKDSTHKDFDMFILNNSDLINDFKGLVSKYYSDELLKSPLAKQEILPPDLRPF